MGPRGAVQDRTDRGCHRVPKASTARKSTAGPEKEEW